MITRLSQFWVAWPTGRVVRAVQVSGISWVQELSGPVVAVAAPVRVDADVDDLRLCRPVPSGGELLLVRGDGWVVLRDLRRGPFELDGLLVCPVESDHHVTWLSMRRLQPDARHSQRGRTLFGSCSTTVPAIQS